MTRTATNTATSSATMVSGTHRYKYFKRPIMPRVNAYAPQLLLAPTGEGENNPLVPLPQEVEAQVKDAGMQTMYRESEAQTTPYTPEYVVAPGDNPEILLLKDMTYKDGLPIGKKEIEMIEHARAKKELEMNLPPFTDEASLLLRKRLMESQELREFKMREKEIDSQRHEKLEKLSQALHDREESNEFMTSQRLESVRLLRMEEREKALEKIRHKRIKALRRIAHERNAADPVLSDGTNRDIINDYFDKGSAVYAPLKRLGKAPTLGKADKAGNGDFYDISSRTVPLDSIGNIVALEYSMPRKLMNDDDDHVNPALLSKTAPAGQLVRPNDPTRVRAAEPRLTSAAQRNLRMTKRDVEEMHQILTLQKRTGLQSGNGENSSKPTSALLTSLMAKKPKGRPPTPDITQERNHPLLPPAPLPDPNSFEEPEPQQLPDLSAFHFDNELQLAAILLQRLIRGRAVQNIMFEGKYRRRELINELKMADEIEASNEPLDANELNAAMKVERDQLLKESTLDALTGSVTSNVLNTLAQEQVLLCFALLLAALVCS
jgi:hypothetical protein